MVFHKKRNHVKIQTNMSIFPHLYYIKIYVSELFGDVTSNGFLVDPTAPDIKKGPTFTRDFGLVENTQFYRSLVKVEWKVEDQESHIERQYLSLRSHLGGDFELSSTQVKLILNTKTS